MKLNGPPGMRIVDATTNEEAGVFDKDGKPLMSAAYIKKRLMLRRIGNVKEVKKHDGKGCV
ncbi:MAG: hypothetical protein ACM3S4_07370 [Burkholderiales bacterium]